MKDYKTEALYKTITTKAYQISKDGHGIIRRQILPDAHIDIEDFKECEEVSKKINGIHKMLILVDARNFHTVTPEASSYLKASVDSTRIATAVIANGLGQKFLVNDIRQKKGVSPIRIFSTENEAITWLLSFKRKP